MALESLGRNRDRLTGKQQLMAAPSLCLFGRPIATDTVDGAAVWANGVKGCFVHHDSSSLPSFAVPNGNVTGPRCQDKWTRTDPDDRPRLDPHSH